MWIVTVPEESGFHDEEVSVLAIELGDYFRFFGGRLGTAG